MKPGMKREPIIHAERIVSGISERDLRLLLIVAAAEARECPKERPAEIADSLLEYVVGR